VWISSDENVDKKGYVNLDIELGGISTKLLSHLKGCIGVLPQDTCPPTTTLKIRVFFETTKLFT
jgi:hypothetical protein